jgi:DNA-binding transcriptional LysR family regulator
MDRIDREMRFLMADVRSLETGLSGRVAVGVGQFWIGHIVPRVIGRLRREAPDVQVQILTGTRDQLLGLLQRGLLALEGIVPVPRIAAWVLLAVGLVDVFLVPTLLARKWSSRER